MSPQENKAIVRRLVEEFWNKGDTTVADELIATGYVHHDPATPSEVRGLEGFKQWAITGRTGLPDMHITIEDMVAEGDKVAKRWTFRATHKGDFFGIPPTGKQVAWTGTTIYRIAGGKIVEIWWNIDVLGLFQQMGFKLVPAK